MIILGDSIAVGLGQEFPGAQTYARVGASTRAILAMIPAQFPVDVLVIISAGTNDLWDTVALEAALRALRSGIPPALPVVWILPANEARTAVERVARRLDDITVAFTPGRDGIHPRSYVALAEDVRAVLPPTPTETGMIDRAVFFGRIRASLFDGSMSQKQVDGISAIFAAFDRWNVTDEEERAYIFATSFWETGRKMQPVREIGRGRGKKYGKPGRNNGQVGYGRGHVQLTWDDNYEKMDRRLGLNGRLIANYDLALDPIISADILVVGMRDGIFTGKDVGDYLGEGEDWENARRVVNGKDRAEQIAGYAKKFDEALAAAKRPDPAPAPVPAPPVPFNERPPDPEDATRGDPAPKPSGFWAILFDFLARIFGGRK